MVNHIFRFLGVAAIVMTFAQCSGDKEQATVSYSIAEEHAKVWAVATDQVLELIDSIPDNQLNYSPDDTIRTFAEQMVHIGLSSVMITNLFLKDIPRPDSIPEVKAETMTKDELKAFVKQRLDKAGDIIKSMSNDQLLNEKVKSYMGNEMTRLEGMIFAHDHLTNHKAKANLYIRLVGKTPPSYHYY